MKNRVRRMRSGGRGRPDRNWVSLVTSWLKTAEAATTATSLLSLQAPTTLALTSDPPEDLTILRIVGDFTVSLSATGAKWVLALVVQDTDWTPSSGFSADADKRILWSQVYSSVGLASAPSWNEPGFMMPVQSSLDSMGRATHIDITPRVRVEPGKALYLVAYEELGAATFTTGTSNIRLLYQRSRRR